MASNLIEAFLKPYGKAPRTLREWVVNSRPRFAAATGREVQDAEQPPDPAQETRETVATPL